MFVTQFATTANTASADCDDSCSPRSHTSACARKARALRRSGVAAVEFACVAVFLVFLALGMLDLARAVMAKETLHAAARSACRMAIKPNATTANVKKEVDEVMNNNNLDPTQATITVQVNGTTADVSTAQTGDKITVIVSLPISQVTWTGSVFPESYGTNFSEAVVMMHQ
jgi:Flp pilus assembly protein TadG